MNSYCACPAFFLFVRRTQEIACCADVLFFALGEQKASAVPSDIFVCLVWRRKLNKVELNKSLGSADVISFAELARVKNKRLRSRLDKILLVFIAPVCMARRRT